MTDAEDFISVGIDAPIGGPAPVPLPVVTAPGLGFLGRYKLMHSLGKGGIAEVFLAVQDRPAGFSKRSSSNAAIPNSRRTRASSRRSCVKRRSPRA